MVYVGYVLSVLLYVEKRKLWMNYRRRTDLRMFGCGQGLGGVRLSGR